ncbi:uncharacterized protein LOC120104478 [Phoenix dactylifera]|uniref:Uncharacterized protein LOC120104478 n=1 Tax=Phoenix dactylifera TaxID=42345 RepID=A0A8B8ZIN4_PHODC|nr:uncharacterized protein LOC120104478 [Phoenix dactylifera]
MAGWVQCFPDYHFRHLPRIASDHCPLLVSTETFTPARPPFRFEKLWFCYPRSGEMVREAWSMPVRGDAMYRVSRRLELTSRRLRRWNREEVGNILRRIEGLEEVISSLQSQEVQSGGLSEGELEELRSHLALHDSLLRQQEIFWRQKSRVQWIQEGDRNTRFFHQATVIRRHQNRIRAIRGEDGQLTEDPDTIQRIVESFFRARWTEQTRDGSLVEIPMPQIRVSEEETVALIRPVSEGEIRETVWSLEGDKAPGPDGFPPVFFRRY